MPLRPRDSSAGKAPQGTIHLGAAHKGGSIYIEVADDGYGIEVVIRH